MVKIKYIQNKIKPILAYTTPTRDFESKTALSSTGTRKTKHQRKDGKTTTEYDKYTTKYI
jgi:hypothetical protein